MCSLSAGLASKKDLPLILRIENESFGDHAWTREEFIEVIRDHEMQLRVVKADDEVVGYVAYEFHDHGIQLVNFAVAPELRRQGIGAWMLSLTLFSVSRSKRTWVRTIVRETNVSTQMFLKYLGFHSEMIIRRPVEEIDEDFLSFRTIPTKVPLTTARRRAEKAGSDPVA